MKLDVDVNEITLSGAGATGEFKIRNSAKAFKILSDGLYSNKIRAVVRELSCNAVDSHVAAGKVDVPFEVHLPGMLEPWFSVRDFGLGLSGEQVTDIYTTYFESTKTDSNDFIGALGLGSKSPFSYTENFTITAIKDGVQRIYSAFINSVGVPSVAEMSVSETTEVNGVEIKFSVTNQYDYNSFRAEARHVFKWFKNRPTIISDDSFSFTEPVYKEKHIVPGVSYAMGDRHESCAVMGNIAYPLSKIPEPEKHFGDLAVFLNVPLILEFEIGELDFAASREELSYVPLTLNNIRKKFELLNDNLAKHVAAKIDELDGDWPKCMALAEYNRDRLYAPAAKKYIADNDFKLVSQNHYSGYTFQLKTKDLVADGFQVVRFRTSYGGASMLKDHRAYVDNAYEVVTEVSVSNEAVFVLNDLKVGCTARARYHYGEIGDTKTVYCVTHSSDDQAVRQAAYDALLAKLHNPPVVVKASTLNKRPPRESVQSDGILRLVKKSRSRGYRWEDYYVWEPYLDALDDTTEYVYVRLHGLQSMKEDGVTEFDVKMLKGRISRSSISELENLVIYGVRKSRYEEISELDNWVKLDEKISKSVKAIKDRDVFRLIAASTLDSYQYRAYTSKTVADLAGKHNSKCPYTVFVNKYVGKKTVEGSISDLASLCASYGNVIDVEKIRTGLIAELDALENRYPLLQYITGGTPEQTIADYITLIDNQENPNVS